MFFTFSLTIWNYYESNIAFFTSLRLALFNGVSVMTGTGYTTTDFSSWGSFSTTLFLIMMLIGGCTGSTTGGIKVFRIQILFFIIMKELKKEFVHLGQFFLLTYKNQLITDDIINSVMVIIIFF